ncbi:AAA family ATPase [Spongiibacter sp. KMU-158]|uniref:AAA family ATPase n=1 Tax=Spongiibacter pelagi TaxID=2760804 RepID=A0A927GXI6_9GAMM|nr:AAA family ATPase [Spongiibacter pelagi]MBD2860208.1 AAA family ATPase [Spongiibacter pelagi]|tara:strand:+ start:1397 stop:2737 length:1341 start_codon:yes stop_codon:yes gene_type:complete
MSNVEKIISLRSQLENCTEKADKLLERIEQVLLNDSVQKLSQGAAEELGLVTKVMARRFSVQEVCDMLNLTRQGLYKAEREGRLPEPDKKESADGRSIRAGYTLDQILNMREIFGRKPDPLARKCTLGVLNQKGGAWKTTTTFYFAQYLALKGYKVLMLDTDPQGSLTTLMGFKPDMDIEYGDTMGPFLLQDEAWAKEEKGDYHAIDDLSYAVQGTYWPNIDLIAGCADLLRIELERNKITNGAVGIYSQRTGKSVDSPSMLLREGLSSLKEYYDVILIDGTPSLNVTTLNVLSACDEICVPTPAHMVDFASTVQFVDIICSVLDNYVDRGSAVDVPNISFLITKFSSTEASYTMEDIIREVFGTLVLKTPAVASEEARKRGNELRSIYEISPSESTNPKGLKSAVENYDRLFDEMLSRVVTGQISTTGNLKSALNRVTAVVGGEE